MPLVGIEPDASRIPGKHLNHYHRSNCSVIDHLSRWFKSATTAAIFYVGEDPLKLNNVNFKNNRLQYGELASAVHVFPMNLGLKLTILGAYLGSLC